MKPLKLTVIPHRARLFLIRNGIIKHRNMTECREAFPFPYSPVDTHVKWIGVARHIEVMHYVHKKG